MPNYNHLSLISIAVLAVTAIYSGQIWGEEDNQKMEEVIVTGVKPISLINMPRNVSVFTKEDIALSGARDLPSLLAREANVTFTSFSGNSKTAKIDIRGSGDTSVSNVLILQDGQRINTPDLAGADFSTILLNQTERIELIRGSNTVRYGSGATSGVVNIITKRADKSAAFVRRERGENDFDLTELHAVAATDKHALSASVLNIKNGGYREFSRLTGTSSIVGYRGEFTPYVELSLKSKTHDDEYQLPGPLSLIGIDDGDINRREGGGASALLGSTEDDTQLVNLSVGIPETLQIRLNSAYRERENFFRFAPDLTPKDKDDLISLRTTYSDIEVYFTPVDFINFVMGAEYQEANYLRTNGGYKRFVRVELTGDYRTKAGYAYLEYLPFETLRLSVGYRRDSSGLNLRRIRISPGGADCMSEFRGRDDNGLPIVAFIDCVEEIDILSAEKFQWRNEAFEYGVVIKAAPDTSFYLSAAKTFRNPNVDEFGLAPAQGTDAFDLLGELRPQAGEQYDMGVKHREHLVEIAATYFESRTKDEIIFRNLPDSGFSLNFNFPNTIKRKGIELQLSVELSNFGTLGFNYGWVDAEIDDELKLPLVPEETFSGFLNIEPIDGLNLNWNTRYVSDRFDGNDFSNTETSPRLKDHTVTDVNLRYKLPIVPTVNINFQITNAFNALYTSTSYLGSGYPSPERQFIGSIELQL